MMLPHCTASSSEFGAHPHHRERFPNLNMMVKAHPSNLMNHMLPWIVRTPPLGYCCTSIILLYTIQIQFGPQETHVIPISWPFSGCQRCCVVPFCEGPIGV